jgi:uncharacterized YccA/Bax inhibitor family protein
MASGNPALNAKTFEDIAHEGEAMTMAGTVNKSAMLLAITAASALWCWTQALPPNGSMDAALVYAAGGAFAGFIVALLTIWKKRWARYTAVAYAALEGLVIGGVSAQLETQFPGIALQASGLTFAVFGAMLGLYWTRVIPMTDSVKLGIVAGTAAIAALYLVDLVLLLFGKQVAFIHESGAWGIGFSLVVVAMAALNLLLDFDFIEGGVKNGAPRYMEWYAAFGLMVTLIWLYLEILRLLAKIRQR